MKSTRSQRVLGLACFAALLAIGLLGAGCGSVLGSNATRTPTGTATNSPTITASPTLTPLPTPTATPTPQLPPNPRSLERWRDIPIPYCISAAADGYATQDEFVDAVHRAFAVWGVATIDTGACGVVADDDGVNQIGWGTLTGDTIAPGEFEAGRTSLHYKECTSGCVSDDRVHLVEADIIIDGAPPRRYRTLRCLDSTMLHETGHFLGLDHLPAPAVMAAETTDCLITLTDADIAALKVRYGDRASPR